ncbi:MAG: grasp-with-spasm system ATP-grasp peptide maturase [Urechidicola sp.]|nr:grasp-with-spasm system ATP-grasp peptide maturase [Urechidicola sp.]
MILILSIENDQSTIDVIEWLILNNQPFFIIQPEDKVDFYFKKNKFVLNINEKKISLNSINSFWYRRGFINLKQIDNISDKNIIRILNEENAHLQNFIYFLLESKKHINKPIDNDINKLITLTIAEKCGLLTPKSFYNIDKLGVKSIITKPIAGSASYIKNNKVYVSFTSVISKKEISQNFKNKYFQENVKKKYELRIFYLNETFWSMAIFSQNDKQTQVDFRIYNHEKPNRNVPYILPKVIEGNLNTLMKELKINSGSIDMIVTPNNEYVFLEVNPIGQFGMTSYPCNYNLEREVANFLSNKDE